eukprot:TRINITY_DN19780_c0_g1_i1.p1 TRINITY_DN19780_c0_g1~~TRINITY_DN19780_c0_g1_i1.p1  ORF type:complete len:159 (+),score=34.11 TRINITY_DN19780_c0_g1_i1:98-574(+)
MNRRKLQRRNYANEYEIRREVEGVYWKQRELFSTDREYNDYLEDIEEAIEDLMSGNDAQRKLRLSKMEEYKDSFPRASATTVKFGKHSVNVLRAGVSRGPAFVPNSPLIAMTAQEWIAKSDAAHISRMESNIITSEEAAAAGYQSHRPWTYAHALAYS